MSLADHVRSPEALSWLRQTPAAVEVPAQLVDGRLPSLAAVEYELSQLRASLRGVVNFGDETPKAVIAQTSAPKPGLVRRNKLQDKLEALAS